jgi:hypothetical protein
MGRTGKIGLGVAAVLLVLTLRFVAMFTGVGVGGGIEDVAHESIRREIALLGSSIYEYHARTGHWPSRPEELAETSLALQSPHWKMLVDIGTNVVVWHEDLKPNPADNANVILAYHNRGLLAHTGRQWVCWGDLRTEYIPTRELRERLHDR